MNLSSLSATLLWLATWPYYWTLCHHTIKPIRRVSRCTTDIKKLRLCLELFRRHKDEELGFVMTASTLSAAANLASLQWPTSHDSPWAARALWFCSLLLAIFALILAAQQAVLLKLLPLPGTSSYWHHLRSYDDNTKQEGVLPTSFGNVLIPPNRDEIRALESILPLFVRRRSRTAAISDSTTTAKSPTSAATIPTHDDDINTLHSRFQAANTVESQPPACGLSNSSTTTSSILLCTKTRTTTSSTLIGSTTCSSRDFSSDPALVGPPLHSGIPDLNMMYIWQAPLMLMSWSWVSYALGLTLWVASPALWPRIRYQDDEKVALFYTVCCAVICLNFGWCSLWAYRAAAPAHSHLLDDSNSFPD